MTKEEAKLVLDNARPQTKEIDRQFYDDEDLNNALNMAIKALEQEETSKDTDFVPVEIEFIGKKGLGYLYKPQQLIITGYYTLDVFEHFGGKYKEKEEGGNRV